MGGDGGRCDDAALNTINSIIRKMAHFAQPCAATRRVINVSLFVFRSNIE